MSTTIPNFLTPKVISNLDTYVYTVVNAGAHIAKIVLNVIPPTGISIIIKQNASTIATYSVPPADVAAINFSASMNCSVSDTISFVIASSVATDQGPNAFKGQLIVKQGAIN